MLQNTSHIALLRSLLQQGTPMTAKELAGKLGVSVRSIRNYVTAINAIAPSRVIFSGPTGYHADRTRAISLIGESSDEEIPQTYRDRSICMLRRLTVENYSSLDIYDLCSELCISYSTLKNDITKINREYRESGVQLVLEGGAIALRGSERDKRKLISQIIFADSSESLINLSILKRSFLASHVDAVAGIVRQAFAETDYYLNGFSYMNLVLHILILVTRIQSGESISERNVAVPDDRKGNEVCDSLCSKIEREFTISLNDGERRNIRLFVSTNAYFIATSNIAELRRTAGDEAVDLAMETVHRVEKVYLIDLASESFLVPFTMHLKGMLQRCTEGSVAPNPMLETIRRECPLIFDVATFIAMIIQPHARVKFSGDEIAYIALHVGAEVERQKTTPDKINCTLLCPDYRGMTESVYNKLLIKFDQKIDIRTVVSFEDDIGDIDDVDLLISTVHLDRNYACRTIIINPLSWEKSQSSIAGAIEQIASERKTEVLRKSFNRFFHQNLFFADVKQTERNDLLDMLCGVLEDTGRVSSEFRYGVNRREEVSSTAFGQIAIPHSVSTEAMESCITVAISPEGITWGSNRVNIVLLVAMSGLEMGTFRAVYEALVSLFDDDEMVRLMRKVRSFEEFRQLVQAKTTIA